MVGGLVGASDGAIALCYAVGSVSGAGGEVGGLVGANRGTVVACYAVGEVTAAASASSAGGLVGSNFNTLSTGSIVACYAIGAVTEGDQAGGLVGRNVGGSLIRASYFDTMRTPQTDTTQGKPTADMQTPTGYTDVYEDWEVDTDGDGSVDDPWDFGTSDEYPVLKVDFHKDGSTADDVAAQRLAVAAS